MIEAGFPISSDDDFNAVSTIAKTIKSCEVAGLCRANKLDIDRAWEAVKVAKYPRIHTFISTSDIHLKYQLKKTKKEVLDDAVAAVKLARSYVDNVEFSAMDATRSDIDYLGEVVQAAVKAGAKIVNIPDTVGYIIPFEFGRLIRADGEGSGDGQRDHQRPLSQRPRTGRCQFACRGPAGCPAGGVHRQWHRRAGRQRLSRRDRHGDQDAERGLCSVHALRQSKSISRAGSSPRSPAWCQPNKAIVGANAFAHESGIHQDGLLKDKLTYEIMTPESVGISKSSIVLGKQSGRHAFRDRIADLGYVLTDEELNLAFKRFKPLCDVKK